MAHRIGTNDRNGEAMNKILYFLPFLVLAAGCTEQQVLGTMDAMKKSGKMGAMKM